MIREPDKLYNILLIEDCKDDVIITGELLRDAEILCNLHIAEDGLQAIDFLRRKGEFSAVVRPDIIFLDLNLPKKSGLEVLKIIKKDDRLKDIPVIVLSTSRNDDDVKNAYQAHANCFITKPVDLYRFADILKSIEKFWFMAVTLPQNDFKKGNL